jgi:subtilase family serine protease
VTSTFIRTAQTGSHSIKAVADVLNQVKESDETNNEKTIIYSTAAADLIIQDITWSPQSPSEGDMVFFTITAKNQGVGKAEYSWLAYYIDDIYQNSLFVSELDADASTNVTCNWTAQAGLHTIRAVANCKNSIMESDETNNRYHLVANQSINGPRCALHNNNKKPGQKLGFLLLHLLLH